MDESPSMTPTEMTSPASQSSSLVTFGLWLAVCVIVVTGLSLAAAHAPPRIRLIFLFFLAFGLLVGWLIVIIAQKIDGRFSRRPVVILAAVFSFVGLAGSTVETVRLEEFRRASLGKEGLAERFRDQLELQATGNPVEEIDTSATMALRLHLSRRLRQLGHWGSPWTEGCWLVELAVAAVASAWACNLTMKDVR